jgi:serine/threonine-protein kinase
MATNIGPNAPVGDGTCAVLDGKLAELARRFEAAWQSGSPTAIEVVLAEVDEASRPAARARLTAIDDEYRKRSSATTAPDGLRTLPGAVETSADRMIRDTVEMTVPVQTPRPEQGSPTASTRYVELRYFKSGGLGALYQARDESLARDVALKFLGESFVKNDGMKRKFEVEAIVTGGLDHPGVVPVYGLGETWDGRPFYAMRFIEGNELQDEIDRLHGDGLSRLGLHRLIGSLIAVCRTVAYAHSRGVIHRDIKPQNIKIGKFGETILLDWGLAQVFQRDPSSVSVSTVSVVQGAHKVAAGKDGGAGTIGYMSPEQLGEHPADPSPATDVYSLGATLYHILTGRPSIAGENCSTIRGRIIAGDFPAPSKLRSDVPKALEAVCQKAMARDAVDRYRTATELADDLQRWVADEDVSVYDEPLFERTVRRVRRHRGAAVASVGLVFALIAGLMGLTGLAGRRAELEHREKLAAQDSERRADVARAEGMRVAARLAAQAVAADVDLRWRILESRGADPELARLLTAASGKLAGSAEQRALQAWTEKTATADPIPTRSWCVYDGSGIQLARYPYEATVGKSYRFRDYFHGQGRDLPENSAEAAAASPIRDVYRTATFISKADDAMLTVMFSAPIWNGADRTGPPLGVISMSVAVGEYGNLLKGMSAGQAAVLIDVRNDRIDGVEHGGLVLAHPRLNEWRLRSLADGRPVTIRAGDADVAKFLELQKTAVSLKAWSQSDSQPSAIRGDYRTDYVDSVANPENRPVKAAIAPIVVQTRHGKASNLEWVVIVQDLVPAEHP